MENVQMTNDEHPATFPRPFVICSFVICSFASRHLSYTSRPCYTHTVAYGRKTRPLRTSNDPGPLGRLGPAMGQGDGVLPRRADRVPGRSDRKSTRLNSSHQLISYAVFCLKK